MCQMGVESRKGILPCSDGIDEIRACIAFSTASGMIPQVAFDGMDLMR